MNITDFTQEIKEFLQDYTDVENFDGQAFADHCDTYFKGIELDDIVTLICNLEDEDTMMEIAHNNFEAFDPWDEAQFNDSYYDMMDQLGLYED